MSFFYFLFRFWGRGWSTKTFKHLVVRLRCGHKLTTVVFGCFRWRGKKVGKPLQEVMGAKGVICFGMGFGVLMAMSQGLSKRSRVSCKAGFEQPGSIVLKEQDTDISKTLGRNVGSLQCGCGSIYHDTNEPRVVPLFVQKCYYVWTRFFEPDPCGGGYKNKKHPKEGKQRSNVFWEGKINEAVSYSRGRSGRWKKSSASPPNQVPYQIGQNAGIERCSLEVSALTFRNSCSWPR